MNGQEFRDYVVQKFKRTDKDTEIYQATTDIIADIRLRLKSENYKEEAYSVGITSLGEYRISLPTDFGHLIGDITVVDVDTDDVYPPLKKISKQVYDAKYGDRLLSDEDESIPQEYCIYGNQIYLGPVPDKITYKYQMNYTTEPYTEVTASTDPVPFSEHYRNVLRCGVLKELHEGLENFDEAKYWQGEYEAGGEKISQNDKDNIADRGNVAYNGV
jgi:hypothetical protein